MLKNIYFWSALLGLLGTILIFFFGIPSQINPNGEVNLILEQTNEAEKKLASIYIFRSYIGLACVALSFILQMIGAIRQEGVTKHQELSPSSTPAISGARDMQSSEGAANSLPTEREDFKKSRDGK